MKTTTDGDAKNSSDNYNENIFLSGFFVTFFLYDSVSVLVLIYLSPKRHFCVGSQLCCLLCKLS